jgi:hypothetical protein
MPGTEKSGWGWKFAALLVSLLAVGGGFAGAMIGAAVSGAASEIETRRSIGLECLAFQSWAIDRLHDGMRPVDIAEFAMAAVTASLGPAIGPREAGRAQASSPYYFPCGYTERGKIVALVREIDRYLPARRGRF